MFTINKLVILLTVFALLVLQVKAGHYVKAKQSIKSPSEKEQSKELAERLDIISQATDHFKFFRDCFMDYEDPSDIAMFSTQLEEAREYLPRSLDKLEDRIRKFSKTARKHKTVDKLFWSTAKLRHKIEAALELTKDDVQRIELGMKKYMHLRMMGSADNFAQEASDISETLKKLRPKECVSGNCEITDE